MDTEFEYQGCRVYVRVREISGETVGFRTGLWRANVIVQPEGGDWIDVGDGGPFGDPKAARADGEVRGRAFVDGRSAPTAT
jgi:hypothetical protein